MSATRAFPRSGDMVPVAARMRYTQLLRVGMGIAVLVLAIARPLVVGAKFSDIWPATLLYLGVAAVAEAGWRAVAQRALVLFGLMLTVDGIYLGAITYLTGGVYSQFRYLVLIYVVAITLLASYRTGLRVTMWNSLVVLGVYNAQHSGLLTRAPVRIHGLPGTDFDRLVVFIAALWLLAMATAMFSAINERELRRRQYELEALTAMAIDLENAEDPNAVGQIMLDHVIRAYEFPRGIVVGGTETSGQVLAHHGAAIGPGEAPRIRASAVLGEAHRSRKTMLVSRFDADHDAALAALIPEARNLIVVPLTAEGRATGTLVLEHSLRSGSRVERRTVSAVERFASYAALALRNAALLEQVQRMAATDGLTAIANRRTFEATLEREIARAGRHNEPVSLVMVDIDHFKALNDSFGHQVGDEVLRNVAAALACECREFDLAARYGGEEFALVLPGCTSEESVVIAERFRRVVSVAPSIAPITASAGVATYPDHARDAGELVRVADEALYESKRAGRDRVTAARPRLGRARGLADTG
jgi:diguanylate cyclase (GGDEF)-like protein